MVVVVGGPVTSGFDAAPWVVAVAGYPSVHVGGDGPVALCEYDGGVWLGDVPNGALLEGGDCWYEVAVDVVPVVGAVACSVSRRLSH